MKRERKIEFNKNNIIDATEKLFYTKGYDETTIDEIAKASEYSKATIYVYFKSKEEILDTLLYKKMLSLNALIIDCINNYNDSKECFMHICNVFVEFSEKHTICFERMTQNINVNFDKSSEIYKLIYEIGEEMNKNIYFAIQRGIDNGEINTTSIEQTVAFFWGCIIGIIKISKYKEAYLKKFLNISKTEFLDYSFLQLFKTILIKEA